MKIRLYSPALVKLARIRTVALCVSCIPVLIVSTGALRGEEELSRSAAAESLLLARDGIRSNLQRIRTWQGVYKFADSLMVPNLNVASDKTVVGPFRQLRVGELRFSIDVVKDSICCKYKLGEPTRYTRMDGSPVPDIPVFAPFEIRNVLTPDCWMELEANRYSGLPVPLQDIPESIRNGRTITRKESAASSSNGRWSTFPDPRQFFVGNMTPLSADAVLESLADAANDPKKRFPVVVTRDDNGDIITVCTFDGNPHSASPTLRTRYSARQAYNITEIRGDGEPNNSSCSATCTYELVDGAWLPNRYEITQRDSESRALQHRVFQSVSVVLNAPVSANTFTIAGLEAEPGDRVFDVSESTLHVVDHNGALVKPEEFHMKPAPSWKRRSITFGAIFLLVSSIALALRLKTSRTA